MLQRMHGMWAILQLHLFHHHLLLSQVLLLPSHEKLFFLLPSFQRILLLGRQGGSKAGETTGEGRLWIIATGSWGGSWYGGTSPVIALWGRSSRTVRNADLGH